MTRERTARTLTGLTALGFLATAGIHASGYDAITVMASAVGGSLGALIPALWIAFSFDLTVLGLIVVVLTLRPRECASPILLIAGLAPFSAAGLQLHSIGFVPPTALLLALGALSWASAVSWRRVPPG